MSSTTHVLAAGAARISLGLCLAFGAPTAGASEQRGATPPGVAHFDVHADGAERVGDDRAVQLTHRVSRDGGATWTEPVRIDRPGDTLFSPHPGEHPQVAARGERVVAIWTSKNPESGRGGAIVSAMSSDGGKTWARGSSPGGDDSKAYHGLLELESDAAGFHAVWLRPGAGDAPKGQGLHYARSTDGASWTGQKTLDVDTCRCCWNRLVSTPDGIGVLYRDGTPRDMAFVAARDGDWQAPVAAGSFGWKFEGCPHVGGALTAGGDNALHALVWTGVDETRAGLYHVASADGGRSWSEPRRIGDAAARESDLVHARGELVAIWSTVADGRSSVRRAASKDGGESWSEARAVSDATRNATQPRIVSADGRAVSFWLERAGSGGASLVVDGRPFGAAAP